MSLESVKRTLICSATATLARLESFRASKRLLRSRRSARSSLRSVPGKPWWRTPEASRPSKLYSPPSKQSLYIGMARWLVSAMVCEVLPRFSCRTQKHRSCDMCCSNHAPSASCDSLVAGFGVSVDDLAESTGSIL